MENEILPFLGKSKLGSCLSKTLENFISLKFFSKVQTKGSHCTGAILVSSSSVEDILLIYEQLWLTKPIILTTSIGFLALHRISLWFSLIEIYSSEDLQEEMYFKLQSLSQEF